MHHSGAPNLVSRSPARRRRAALELALPSTAFPSFACEPAHSHGQARRRIWRRFSFGDLALAFQPAARLRGQLAGCSVLIAAKQIGRVCQSRNLDLPSRSPRMDPIGQRVASHEGTSPLRRRCDAIASKEQCQTIRCRCGKTCFHDPNLRNACPLRHEIRVDVFR
jgi:hypothetical protein